MNDMPKHPRLILRGNRYYHRAAIPQDIKESYPKSEETFSLGTSDYQEALRKVRLASVEVDQKFDDHRRQVLRDSEPPVAELTLEQINAIGEIYYAHLLEEDEGVRLEEFSDETQDRTIVFQSNADADTLIDVVREHGFQKRSFEEYAEDIDESDTDARYGQARGKIDPFYFDEAEEILSWTNVDIRLAPNSPSWKSLAMKLQASVIQANKVRKKRNEGDVIEAPVAASLSASGGELQVEGKLLSAVKNEWIAERSGRTWVEKTEKEHRVWMDNFLSAVGDKPVEQYEKSDARQFKNLLMKLPANWNKKPELKGLSISSASARADTLSMQPMSDKNINKIMGFVGAFWGWSIDHYDDKLRNPFKGMKIKIRVSARDERDPFSLDELRAIFNSPLYTGCKSARHWGVVGDCIPKDHGRYWVPLIGLYTGARSGEIIQLRLDDICEGFGVNYLNLTDEGKDQRLKSATSRRIIPIHADLIGVGFMTFVEERRARGEERLFPELPMGADGYYSSPYSRHFRRLLEALDIKKSSKEVFHSFRHNFEDACRDSDVSKEVMDALQGHGEVGMSARYGRGYMLRKLDENMRKLRYRDLDLNHLMAT